ncbi:late control protein D [Aurantimonas sp. C2-6-R+9]|uniref:phage late control D family protein n=1 Tax=unclassified Aurantimonas TaxID=2638230 RepID=UPI002E18CC3D|nr:MULTISPECIES: late control protein D [unclassified Aurantimonas]MEC5291966.1 late control protein D [Aurantimonas sp. C2-3-R2]MEC5382078.1 late control protein D [Aurantimonas sp. C2-6-R+9]MEC5413052.1 late control protein D [Aurantimonas sp. C2-4-R8]
MAKEAAWILLYRGVDITGDLDPMTTSVRYTDKLHGEADEIEVTVQDKDGRWRGPWCPEPSDTMELWYGWKGAPGTYAGRFELDEPEVQIGRGGDTMTMRGIAAPITASLRTERTADYEDMTVEAIAKKVANRAGLTVKGAFNKTKWRRKTQRRMRDLEFLVQLGEDTDHYVSVRGTEIQFWPVDQVDGAPVAATFTVNHPDVVSFTGRFETQGTNSKAESRYFHDEDKRLIKAEISDDRVKTGDILKIVERTEDEAQAALLAKGRLHQTNRNRRSGSLTLVGRPDLVAGSVIALGADFGKWAGRYVADSSDHSLTRGPYPTVLTLKEAREAKE